MKEFVWISQSLLLEKINVWPQSKAELTGKMTQY